MKVKELIAKYPGYMVIEKGYPDSIPFNELPRELDGLRGKAYEKVEGELRVYGYSVSHKPFTSVDITPALFNTGKKPNNISYKGELVIYLKGRKRKLKR